MPGFTSRLNLYKPGGGSSGIIPDEVVDIDKINDNSDIIDASLGAPRVTSSTRPATPFDGQTIYESDTNMLMVRRSDISQWVPPGTVLKVADFTALAALSTTPFVAGDLVFVTEGAVYMRRTGSSWEQITVARFATQAARDSAYAKAAGAYLASGLARAYCTDVDREFIYYTTADNPRVPADAWCQASIIRFRKQSLGTNPVPTSEQAVSGALGAFAAFGPGTLDVHFGGTLQLNTAMGSSLYLYTQGVNRVELRFEKANAGVDKHSLASFWTQAFTGTAQFTVNLDLSTLASEPTASILTNAFYDATFTPAWMTGA